MSDVNDFLGDGPSLRLLVAENDPDTAPRLVDFFSAQGHDVTQADDGETALQEIRTFPPYNVALLSVSLPEQNGFAVLREARASGVDTPVILLASTSESQYKLRGFDLGADDYVPKPFDLKELAARVRAVHRRSQPTDHDLDDRHTFRDITVDFSEQAVQRNGAETELTDLEVDLLKYLISRRSRTVSRAQLLRDVWGISSEISTRTIDRHIAALRKKVEPDPDDPTHLQTVYGIGYKFVE